MSRAAQQVDVCMIMKLVNNIWAYKIKWFTSCSGHSLLRFSKGSRGASLRYIDPEHTTAYKLHIFLKRVLSPGYKLCFWSSRPYQPYQPPRPPLYFCPLTLMAYQNIDPIEARGIPRLKPRALDKAAFDPWGVRRGLHCISHHAA